MPFRFKSVRKADIAGYFGGNKTVATAFWGIAKYAGYKRLLSLIQRIEQKGHSREDALYFVHANGARFVERALKFPGLNLDLAVKAVQTVGVKRLEEALALAKRRKRNPENVLRRYVVIAENLSLEDKFQRNEAIKKWLRSRGASPPQVREFLGVALPFINSFEPRRVNGYAVRLGVQFMQGIDSAPVTAWLAPVKENIFSSVGFMSLFFSREGDQKVLSIHDVQTDPILSESIEPEMRRGWIKTVFDPIEEHARAQGFKRIRLLRPERHPLIAKSKNPRPIIMFYYKVAKMCGLRKKTKYYMEKEI